MKNLILLVIALCSVTSVASAKAVNMDCKYAMYANVHGMHADQMNFKITYDTNTGRAFVMAPNGMTKLDYYPGTDGMTFLEKLDDGVIQSTTITKDGKSVHSRHTILKGHLLASQYYGMCVKE